VLQFSVIHISSLQSPTYSKFWVAVIGQPEVMHGGGYAGFLKYYEKDKNVLVGPSFSLV